MNDASTQGSTTICLYINYIKRHMGRKYVIQLSYGLSKLFGLPCFGLRTILLWNVMEVCTSGPSRLKCIGIVVYRYDNISSRYQVIRHYHCDL